MELAAAASFVEQVLKLARLGSEIDSPRSPCLLKIQNYLGAREKVNAAASALWGPFASAFRSSLSADRFPPIHSYQRSVNTTSLLFLLSVSAGAASHRFRVPASLTCKRFAGFGKHH